MRMRKDGLLKELVRFTPIEFKKYLLKLKFMAGAKMNIDYLPQDGRFDFDVDINGKHKKIDVRVSFMPGLR
jgi:type II secretory ATPase GspE/PulE/Tfp pilus assembly ATPase PilB-like protein